jgi:hypothetical protein
VAEFLGAHMGGGVTAEVWAAAMNVPWKVDAPNHGFMLVDDGSVVGAYLAYYSERMIGDRVERFCNLGSWCVLPDYRRHSLRLIRTLLDQPGYHFTDLSPSRQVGSINARLGFQAFDTGGAMIPGLPWPPWPGRPSITSSHDVIEETLTGADLEIYQDHMRAAAARHVLLRTRAGSCYVMFRRARIRRTPVATVLHVGNREVFRRAAGPLARYLLARHQVLAVFVESRVAGGRPRMAFAARLNSNRKMYRSSSLGPDQIDYLYSELTCVDW